MHRGGVFLLPQEERIGGFHVCERGQVVVMRNPRARKADRIFVWCAITFGVRI